MDGRVVCFGELLVRLTTPGHERLSQAQQLNIFGGGAEANVAVSLSHFGHEARVVSTVPDNPLAGRLISQLRSHGVDVDHIQTFDDGRMGLYFLETGAVLRPSRIVYDRTGTTFAQTRADQYDWPAILDGAGVLHISGITPAVGKLASEAALAAVTQAREMRVTVSFDGNYRDALWKSWAGDGPTILRELLEQTDIAFINERDIALILGGGIEERDTAVARAFDVFPNLTTIAATKREQSSVSNQSLSGSLYTRNDGNYVSRRYEMASVVDRIGGGDAFAAGVLHGLITKMRPDSCIEFATAASALKHSIPGDWNLVSVDEVSDAMSDNGLDVRR